MLYFPKTKILRAIELPIASGVTNTSVAEGQPLSSSTVAGVFGVKPSTATASEIFAGVAIADRISIASFPAVEQTLVGAGLTYALAQGSNYVGSTIGIYNVTTGLAVAAGGGATQYSISGSTITFGSSIQGQTVVMFYRYTPTVVQAQAIQGDINPGGAGGFVVGTYGQVGVIKSGIIYTSEYDTTVNWYATNPSVTLGANGRFTIGGTGTVTNAVVVAAPGPATLAAVTNNVSQGGSVGVANSFLGLMFEAPN